MALLERALRGRFFTNRLPVALGLFVCSGFRDVRELVTMTGGQGKTLTGTCLAWWTQKHG